MARELDALRRVEQEKVAAETRAAHYLVQLREQGEAHAAEREAHDAEVSALQDHIDYLEREIAHMQVEATQHQDVLDSAVVEQIDQADELDSYRETNTELIAALQEIVDKGGRGGLAIAKRVLGSE